MSTRFKCPKCGNDKEFYAIGYIEHHEVVVDNTGMWIADYECYDSYFGDERMFTCPECYFEGYEEKFEV